MQVNRVAGLDVIRCISTAFLPSTLGKSVFVRALSLKRNYDKTHCRLDDARNTPYGNVIMVNVASFSRMDEGTREDYALLDRFERAHVALLPDCILAALAALDQSLEGYRVTRLGHSSQTATRAEVDGADIEMIVGALVHDLGDDLAPMNYSQLAASIVRPYVREEVSWVLMMHGLFQMPYYAHHLDLPIEGHLAYADHPWYESFMRFRRDWDQMSFNPDYATSDLTYFEPMIREIFTRTAFDSSVLNWIADTKAKSD